MADQPKVDFSALLGKRREEIKPPPVLPSGTYAVTVHQTPTFDVSSRKGTPFVRFQATPQAHHEDVDEAELPENWRDKKLRLDFYLTDEADFMLADLANKLELEWETLYEVVEQLPGHILDVEVSKQSSEQNPDREFNNVERVLGPSSL